MTSPRSSTGSADPRCATPTRGDPGTRPAQRGGRRRDGRLVRPLPDSPCRVEPIPAFLAADAPYAYYFPPAPDGSRPGTYFINTSDPTGSSRTEAESIAFHEAIPGHHLQIAISQELEGIPEFQRHDGATSYIEGWGLYAERLADEMGLYSGPLGPARHAHRRMPGDPPDWSSTPGCTRSGGPASRRSTTSPRTTPGPARPDRPRGRPLPRDARPGARLQGRPARDRAAPIRCGTATGRPVRCPGFHDVVLGSGAVTLPVLGTSSGLDRSVSALIGPSADELRDDRGELERSITLDAVTCSLDHEHLRVGLTATQLGDVVVVDDRTRPAPHQRVGRRDVGHVLPEVGRDGRRSRPGSPPITPRS